MQLGLTSSIHAQNYNPKNYDTGKIIQEMRSPHNDLSLVVAHRGLHATLDAANDVPENSLRAIGDAAQAGIEIVEVDIKVTQDGVPVLSHDTSWGREWCGLPTFGSGGNRFNPFLAPGNSVNDSVNPLVSATSLGNTRSVLGTTYLRPLNVLLANPTGCSLGAVVEYPPTLKDVLDYITKNKIAVVLALDIKDDATAQICWSLIKTQKDYRGSPYSQSVVFKMPGRVYKSATDFQRAFGIDYVSVLLWPFYGTADIAPQAVAIDSSYGTESASIAGFGSEANIIASIRSIQSSSIQLVGLEVNLKQAGGILKDVLANAKASNPYLPPSVGSFNPEAEYIDTSDASKTAQFFNAAGPNSAHCCYKLSDLFYKGASNGQPSDTADYRGDLNFLIANGDNIITTDSAQGVAFTLAGLKLRNTSYLQASTGGGGGTGGTSSLRLLPLGDSITYGQYSSTNNGYRGPLRDELMHEGFTADFVGTLSAGPMNDNYHEGHSGLRIDQVDGFVGGPMGQYRPNVVTLMLGTNDMNQSYDLANAPARLGKIIDDVLRNGPDAAVLVASLVPSTDPVVEANIVAFNQQVPGVVQARSNQGKHVAFVNMNAVTTTDLADRLHPNDGGYQKIADAFNVAMQQVSSVGWITTPVPCASIGVGCSDVAILAGSQPASQNAGGSSGGG